MEYAAGGDLQTLLDEDMVPYERDVISFTRQLLEGLVYVHDLNLVHLDIKPQNLVLMGEFPDCAVKLCDFEISRVLTPGREVREILGTPDYVAPEILLYEPITKKTDMWSLGVLTYVLLTGFLPFGGDTDQETFLQISRGELDFPEELFEDISPEAINFIQRLLVRQPERRMSAQECLSHAWMKKEMERPITPATHNPPATPLSTQTSVPAAPTTPTFSMTPAEITSPTRDIGRPPLHPNTPLQPPPPFPEPNSTLTSPVTLMSPAFPSSIQRQESRTSSRHNLDRIRSMSKSREVLSERIQMSNLKKTISKSRERLFDAKLGLSKSRERLMGLRSFSQSVEVLSALSQLSQGNSRYQSCSNIFIAMLTPSDKEADVSCRMYKSLAAIDQLDGIDYSHKLGYFESRFSKDDDDYNDLVTRHNTNMNSVITSENSPKSGRCDMANEARLRGGGRGGRADICDKRCPRHSHRQPEAKLTQKIPKVNRAERMKREAQRRRKERKEREREEKEKQKGSLVCDPEVASRTNNKTQEKHTEDASSPSGRRRSVSHVEQRLAERHERQQERLEKQEREERRSSVSGRRRSSVDLDRSPVSERLRLAKNNSNNTGVSQERSQSTTPTARRKSKKHSSGGSDVSQASSLESVDGSLDSPRTPARPKRPTTLDLPEIKVFSENMMPLVQSGDVNDNLVKQEIRGDIDEAYVSLDEPSIIIYGQIQSTECNESSGLITDARNEQLTQEVSELQHSSLIERSEPHQDSRLLNALEKEDGEESKNNSLQIASERGLGGSGELTIIEEEGDGFCNRKSVPSYVRSISTGSDIGSMISEGSEGSHSPSTDTELQPDWKGRSRSVSILSGSPGTSRHKGRSRSNSVHVDPSGNGRVRPWGSVCDGAVARALEKFNIKSDDTTPAGKSTRIRRSSSPAMSPSVEDTSSLLEQNLFF
ncbi:uncharacterized protein [Procambarus clarkii]|nr:inner centromere protein A-like isoform X2 [Procambarus clarkii]